MATGRFLEDLEGRIPVINNATAAAALTSYVFAIPDAATADYDIVVDLKFEVIDVIVGKIGTGTGNTVQIKNGATVISDAIAAAVDKAVTRAGTIDRTTSNNVVAAGWHAAVHRDEGGREHGVPGDGAGVRAAVKPLAGRARGG